MNLALAALCVIVCGIGLWLRSEYEKKQISVERTVIESEKITKDRTIVFLSDLHGHHFPGGNQTLLDRIEEINPEVVLIGGDMITAKENPDIKTAYELMEQLAARYLVFYGRGNHEMRMYRNPSTVDLIEQYENDLYFMGVRCLTSNRILLGDDLALDSVELRPACYRKIFYSYLTLWELRQMRGEPRPGRFQVLLCHSPHYFDVYRQWGADLTLAGHYHGGTIRIPFFRGLMTPQIQILHPYSGGTYREEGKTMVVSRGLGTHSVNIRLNNKPHVVVVELKSKKEKTLGE